MRRILTVLGARPQFVKASMVSARIATSSVLSEVVVHTGQHFDPNMSAVFFAELGMRPPAYDLEIHGGSHGAMTGRMIEAVERVLLYEKPDAVLVYGDTNSTLAGALAAVKLRIPVAYVEAGLRSFNSAMPEEINRAITDRISQWLFTPTEVARRNLAREGISESSIIPVGDVMYDLALYYGNQTTPAAGALGGLGLEAGRYALVTIHRAENTDDERRLGCLVEALAGFSKELPVVFPLHPRTRAALERFGLMSSLTKVAYIIEPVGYLDMVQLERFAALIATDSGGVQKEAFFFNVPCVTLRDETEWIELVESGWNRLAPPTSTESILAALRDAVGSRGLPISPYGTGDAARRIVEYLSECVNECA